MMELYQHEFVSPLGVVYVVLDGAKVRAVDFEGYEHRLHRLLARHYRNYALHRPQHPCDAVSRLKDYFAGDLTTIDQIGVATNGTDFQHQVWDALRKIPAGTIVSYGAIAKRIGRPTAYRAVGMANGSNPVNIVAPCHRVVGTNHELTGYGGGIERKQWLLRHEDREKG